ncbi:S8 family serine peptidase [Yinghuangia sp. YIM S09857]|uniref:S8 family serine peptidase n=1 Tax=Yinghuangia sp. YIM S09857 TaxID=3436929 RepID=UPI003F52B131
MAGPVSPTGRRLFVCAIAAVSLHAGLGLAESPHAHADSVRAAQWYLDSWKIDEAWRISRGAGVTVAVVDSGVDASHSDLAGQIAESPLGLGDVSGHGTQIASLIVGTGATGGGQGVHGVAPDAKVLSFRIPDMSAAGVFETDKAAAAIRAAADSRARIVNISNGGVGRNPAQTEAVAYALGRGKLVVASGGNVADNGPGVVYPAALPGVLGVSAVGTDGRSWRDGNTGYWISLGAPGVDIPAACTAATKYCLGTGSSSAAALVSGVAALVWSAHPDWTANQVIRRLVTNTSTAPNEQIPNDDVGFGIVSPRRALQSNAPPGPADVNPLLGVRGDPPPAPPTAAPVPDSPANFPSAKATSSTATASPTTPTPERQAMPSNKGGDPGTVWGVVGTAAGALTAVAVLALIVRHRTRRGGGPAPP